MYKIIKSFVNIPINTVQRLSDTAFIPFDPANTDYQQFKQNIMNGKELQDADGNPMSADAAKSFIATLP